MPRMVQCPYLKKQAPGLEHPPVPGPLGQEIFLTVSQEAFTAWLEMQTKIINEYRLDLSERAHRQRLMQQMRTFLKLDNKEDLLSVGTPS